jgi:hypothetical protein
LGGDEGPEGAVDDIWGSGKHLGNTNKKDKEINIDFFIKPTHQTWKDAMYLVISKGG